MSIESPFTLILASAGSGKTYTLTHHLLKQVHDGLVHGGGTDDVVERILAATFTRAAAGEIVERVLKLLAAAVVSENDRIKLSQELRGDNTLSLDVCGTMLLAVVRKLHRLQICTLDAFLIRVAQAFAPELGIAQPWTILDDAADQAVALEAIDELFDQHTEDAESIQRMVDLLIMLGQGRYRLAVRQQLFEHLRRGHDALHAGPSQAWEVIGCGDWEALDPAALTAYCAGLSQQLTPHVPMTKAKPPQPDKRWMKAIVSLCEDAPGSGWKDLLNGGLLKPILTGDLTYCGSQLSAAMVAALNPLVNHCAHQLLTRLRARNLSTRDLLQHYDIAYRNAKATRFAWRFEDFTRLLVEAGVAAPDKLDDFYFRLDGEFDHVLLDEFQDTSILQWHMLQPLAEEIISGGEGKHGVERTLLLVGDVKQTLYGWRNAEPRLLDELIKRWPQLQQQSLVKSFRSSQVVIDTVNQVFQTLLDNPALNERSDDGHFPAAAEVWDKWFEKHTTVYENRPGFCRLSTCADGDEIAELQSNALKLAARRVQELSQAQPGATIAILLRRKKFIAPVMAELQRLNVPCSGEGGNPLTDDAAVSAALSLLHLIDHPSDSAALYHVGCSPLGDALGLKSDTHRIEVLKITRQLRTRIMDAGLGHLLNYWLSLFAPSCDGRNFRRFEQLIELAHRSGFDGGELRPFLEQIRLKRIEEAGVASVRVMTIHGSKGRQFNYVVLPDLDDNFLMGGEAGILVDRPHVLEPAACITYGPDAVLRGLNSELARIDQDSKVRQVIEELCSLYVAITRAEIGLEMIVHPQGPPKKGELKLPRSAAGVLRGALTPGPAAPDTQLWPQEKIVFPTAAATIETSTDIPGEESQPLVITLAPPPAGQSRNRPVVSPSAMEGEGFTNLSGLLAFDRSASLDRGTVLHRWFEQIEWMADFSPTPDRLRERVADLSLPDKAFDELVADFTAACAREGVRKLLDRASCSVRLASATDLEIWRERSFVVPMFAGGLDSLVRGQLDRVVVGRKNGRPLAAEIVDYKTDRVGAGSKTLKDRVEHYGPQIRAYRKAVAQLLGLDLSAVSASLMFTEIDTVVSVHD